MASGGTLSVAQERQIILPVLAPLTGFVALEGASQRNGALLAVAAAPAGLTVEPVVLDTATQPEIAVNAFNRGLAEAGGAGVALAISAPILGTQMLALLPLAADAGVPLVTVSGTAAITEQDNPWVFRFFPGDAVVKAAQARFTVQELGLTRPALITQTTAYGQSGLAELQAVFARLGVTPVASEAVDTSVKDLRPALQRARAAGADSLILHLHAPSTALAVRQAAAMGLGLPIIAGSAMHQPATAALLEPAELEGVCAETSASPLSGGNAAMVAFTTAYEEAFGAAPDAFAVGQYDAVQAVLTVVAAGADSPAAVRDALASNSFSGLAMTYRSDGTGNMAHSALIVCYDGQSRVPAIVRRYDNPLGPLAPLGSA
ncbi:MAG: ABC transporter substrate-binding protein, partial [Alphaproteobacteria bacterium]